jgi:protein-disulfide isomerase
MKEAWEMVKKLLRGIGWSLFVLLFASQVFAQEDRTVQLAVDIVKAQLRLPPGAEIKVLEKRESPIPEFYSVKLVISLPDKEVPIIVYVDKTGEKVFIGNLFIRGENVTMKEAGPPKTKKIDMRGLDLDKSPFIGPKEAKVTLVEFGNFECSHCLDSWAKLKPILGKYPREIRYVFKHLPFQAEGKTFELSEMAAAAQEVSLEAFWLVHDFLFTSGGQSVAKLDRRAVQLKFEQLLRDKNQDVKAFQMALESGKGKSRVLDDMALANKLRIAGTPTKIVNGDIIVGPAPDNFLDRYLGK